MIEEIINELREKLSEIVGKQETLWLDDPIEFTYNSCRAAIVGVNYNSVIIEEDYGYNNWQTELDLEDLDEDLLCKVEYYVDLQTNESEC